MGRFRTTRYFATMIKKLRARKGLSVPALARRAGVSWNTVYTWEKTGQGRLVPCMKILNALGADIEVTVKD